MCTATLPRTIAVRERVVSNEPGGAHRNAPAVRRAWVRHRLLGHRGPCDQAGPQRLQAGNATASGAHLRHHFLVVAGGRIGRRPRIGSLRTYALLALLDPALPFLLILIGLRSSTAANAALLVSLESFVAVGFAVVIGTERVTRAFATGAVLAVTGALLVSSRGISALAPGDLLFLAATVPLGLAVVVARRIAPSTPSSEITRYQTGLASAIVVPCVAVEWLLTGGPTAHHAGPGAWGAAIYAGTIGLAMSNLTFNFALGKLSAATAGLALNLVPLIGVVAAVAVLGEHLTMAEAVGAGLIVVGLTLPSCGELLAHLGHHFSVATPKDEASAVD
jgi:drug/metabolite transporter (DMT)-like permease